MRQTLCHCVTVHMILIVNIRRHLTKTSVCGGRGGRECGASVGVWRCDGVYGGGCMVCVGV